MNESFPITLTRHQAFCIAADLARRIRFEALNRKYPNYPESHPALQKSFVEAKQTIRTITGPARPDFLGFLKFHMRDLKTAHCIGAR